MTFADFYIIDPLETASESAAYAGLNHYEAEVALEGFKDGVKSILKVIGDIFRKIGLWFQRRWQVLMMRIKVFSKRKDIKAKIGKEKYQELKKSIPAKVKEFQELRRLAKNSKDPNVSPQTFKQQVNAFLDNMTKVEKVPDSDVEIQVESGEFVPLTSDVANLSKDSSNLASELEASTKNLDRMDDEDPKKKAAEEKMKDMNRAYTQYQQDTNAVSGMIDDLTKSLQNSLNSIDNLDADTKKKMLDILEW